MIGLKDVAEHETFPEAFADFYQRITNLVAAGTMTEQVLFSTNFIVHRDDDGELPLEFSGAMRLAHEIGLLNEDGKLQKLTSDPPQRVIGLAFARAGIQLVDQHISVLLERIAARDNESAAEAMVGGD